MFFLKVNFFNFYYFQFNKDVFYFNLKVYNSLISNKYKLSEYFLLNYPSQYKYNWISSKTNSIKIFFNDSDKNFNFEFSEFYKNSDLNDFNKIDFLDSMISFKRNSGFIKKENKFNSVVLHKLHGLKMNFIKNNFNISGDQNIEDLNDDFIFHKERLNKNFLSKNYIKFNNNENLDFQFNTKSLDIRYKTFLIFKKNRQILNDILIKKNLKQHKFNKIIKNFIKKSPFNAIHYYEFKLINILIRTHFFANFKDAVFFIENSYVLVNNKIVKDINYILKTNDTIKIIFNKYYYLYYRKGLHNLINNISKYNSYLWKINKNKFNPHKQQTSHTPNWILRSMYFKDDFPRFLEVDYITMTLTLLYKSYDFKDYDFYSLKFINAYLMRLYNWKYIT